MIKLSQNNQITMTGFHQVKNCFNNFFPSITLSITTGTKRQTFIHKLKKKIQKQKPTAMSTVTGWESLASSPFS
jgi:hypothetical protein